MMNMINYDDDDDDDDDGGGGGGGDGLYIVKTILR